MCLLFIFIEITCPAPESGMNTEDVHVNSLKYLESYTYSCMYGYETSDKIYTECLSNGSLSLTSPPNCSGKYTDFWLGVAISFIA